MDGVLFKGADAEIAKEMLNQGSHREAVFPRKEFSSKESPPVRDEFSEVKKEKLEVNGLKCSETQKSSEAASQKTTSSPTFIGSALKAVKNLFSPEKPKSVHSGVLSPINQQKNAAGPPCGSICVSGKTELFCSESGISFHSAENIKSNTQINEAGGIQSPLTVDSLGNADESFLTTVSVINDSFHSAVTDFDESGDPLRPDPNAVDSAMSRALNSEYLDSCNNTLNTNDSYLENTTLKVGSITPEGKSHNVSIHSNPQNPETLNSIKSIDAGKGEGIEDGIKNGKEVRSDVANESKEIIKVDSEMANPKEEVEMADIFLSKSFEEAGISVKDGSAWKNIKNETGTKDVEVLLEGSNRDCFLGDSISTTTVVLEPHRPELDNLLLALQSGGYGRQASSTSFDENLRTMSSSENVENLCDADSSLNNKQPSECHDRLVNHKAARMLFQKKSNSERNSPGNRSAKVKLNKSDELINRRTSSYSPDRKINCSVDISLMKNVESSELSEGFVLSHQSEVGKTEMNPTDKPEEVAVTSQLSYTILVNHNTALNRPVIDSSCSFNSPKKQTFQAVEEENSDKVHASDCLDGSFDRTTEVKQSTPLCNGNKEKGQQFFRCPSLKLNSPEPKENARDGPVEAERIRKGKSDLLSKAMDIFSSSDAALEFSPVSPGDGREDSFFNSTEACIIPREKFKDSGKQIPIEVIEQKYSRKPGSPRVQKSPRKKGKAPTPIKYNNFDEQKLNLTYDKAPVSPKFKKCNSTFIKELSEAERTFDVTSPDPAQLNKTYDKPVGPLNHTFDLKADGLGAQKLNETFDKKRPESPLYNKVNQVVGSCQEMLAQEMNKTFDSVPIAETTVPKPADAVFGDAKKAQPQSETLKSEGSSDFYDSQGSSKNSVSLVSSEYSTALPNDEFFVSKETGDLSEGLQKLKANESLAKTVSLPRLRDLPDEQEEEKLLNSLKDDKLQCDPELVQLIQEQFSSNDIEKICSVVQDFSSVKLSTDILKASEQFDKSLHGSVAGPEFSPAKTETKDEKSTQPLSPKSFDFLSSIGGKPTGRDWSRESLYVKFDPLVQPTANSLIDFTKEGEVLPPLEDSPTNTHNSSICERLLNISPQKKTADIVPPLTPLSHKARTDEDDSKTERLKELQNEIYFLKNLYAERERLNKARVEDCENQLAKMIGDVCFLEDKLKEANEKEKSLVKKIKEQTQSIGQLTMIAQEYVKGIAKLTSELETLKSESAKQIEGLSLEKDSYMTHLQNTEAAFTDVHTKYEKSKKTIASLKANEAMFRNTIAEQANKMEEFVSKAREAEEKASAELQKAREELNEAKTNHLQEMARIKAQLRKTELKVEALQESLDQKVKENQQLTAICDELIEGKK